MREEDKHGRHERADSPGAGRALAEAAGTTQEAEEKGLPAAAGADHEPDPAGNHLHHGSGDLGAAGGAGVRR